ncbi:MAG TPA: hypothetical protein VGO53_01915 [Steroidobacteraceae bacterium]|nr:hypothetical protein [Steroidobacteraceae bacterium]
MSKITMRSTRVAYRGHSGWSLRAITLTAVLVALASLGLAPGAARAEGQVTTTSIGGLALPEYIGVLEFIGERTGLEPNTSASYSYRAMGLALDISVFDLGANGLADGVDAPELVTRYTEAKEDLAIATRMRRLKPLREVNVELGGTTPRTAREALYKVKRHNSGGTTYLLFTAAHGLVIEARFDVAPGFEEDGSISHGEILAALGEAIPVTADAVVQARARLVADAEAAMKVAILWDPATPRQESKIWLAYLFARAAYAANEPDGGPAVGEREASFEEEVRGRTIAVSTFRDLRRKDAHLASEYFSDIDRVEAAGFLREYVWSYLHHTSWLAPPAGLDLKGFDDWRSGHLLNHVAVTHGRIAFRLAAAALDPAATVQ